MPSFLLLAGIQPSHLLRLQGESCFLEVGGGQKVPMYLLVKKLHPPLQTLEMEEKHLVLTWCH